MISDKEAAAEKRELISDLQYELTGPFACNIKGANCVVCNKLLGMYQIREYGPDGYDYLVCAPCVRRIRKKAGLR